MDLLEQSKHASSKDFKRILKHAGRDASRRTNDQGQTLLHIVAEAGNDDVMKLLLGKHTKQFAPYINCRDALGWTPLHYAASGGKLECMNQLLHHAAGRCHATAVPCVLSM